MSFLITRDSAAVRSLVSCASADMSVATVTDEVSNCFSMDISTSRESFSGVLAHLSDLKYFSTAAS